jgi:Fic family protein
MNYIHEQPGYPKFTWDKDLIVNLLTSVSVLQGRILGKMQQFGFGIQQEAMLNAMTEEITKSSEIEGEILNSAQVRTSLARRLNINLEQETTSSHHIEGMVDVLMDAVQNYKDPLTVERLFGWHGALFPTGRSGLYKIRIAEFRTGEMRIVSSNGFRDIVHYEAPKPDEVLGQMSEFLHWLDNGNENILLKVALAHLWADWI